MHRRVVVMRPFGSPLANIRRLWCLPIIWFPVLPLRAHILIWSPNEKNGRQMGTNLLWVKAIFTDWLAMMDWVEGRFWKISVLNYWALRPAVEKLHCLENLKFLEKIVIRLPFTFSFKSHITSVLIVIVLTAIHKCRDQLFPCVSSKYEEDFIQI